MLKTGTIKYFDAKKGFGFLREKETHTEIFFHKKGVKYAVKEFDVVTFETKRTPHGVKAFNVKLKQDQ
jgi:CspA family cold shock protein